MAGRNQRDQEEFRKACAELAAAWKSDRHGPCARCRDVGWEALMGDDLQGLRLAARLCLEHAEPVPPRDAHDCSILSCARHETLPFPLARRLLRLAGAALEGLPSSERKWADLPLSRPFQSPWETLDSPSCRRELPTPHSKAPTTDDLGSWESGFGSFQVWFTRTEATAHVLPQPPPAGGPDLHRIDAIARGWDLHFAASRDASLARYEELKQLALADLEIEPPTWRELKPPFAFRKKKS